MMASRTVNLTRLGASMNPREPITLVHWKATGLVGAALLFGGNGAVIFALKYVTSSLVALLVSTTPFWMLILGRFWLGEKVYKRDLVGILLGFIGVFMLVGNKVGVDSINPIGPILGLFASFSWAVGTLYARRAPLPKGSLLATSMEMLSGGVLLTMAGLALGEPSHISIHALSWKAQAAFWYLVVFGSWVGFTAYAWLVKVAPLPLVSSYAYVNPVVAMILGSLVLGEPISIQTLIAASIIVAAVAITVMRPKSPRPAPATEIESAAATPVAR